MNITKKFDKILNLFYDKKKLHWNEINCLNFIGYTKRDYNIDWSDEELNLVMTMLKSEGYIDIRIENINGIINSYYHLTPKGVLMKEKGGFYWELIIKKFTNYIILWAAIFSILGTLWVARKEYIEFKHQSQTCHKSCNMNRYKGSCCDGGLLKSSYNPQLLDSIKK